MSQTHEVDSPPLRWKRIAAVGCLLPLGLCLICMVGPTTEDDWDDLNDTSNRLQLQAVFTILNQYESQNGSLPPTDPGLELTRFFFKDRTVPTDGWGHELIYNNEPGYVTVTSLGKDGRVGGTGYNADLVFIVRSKNPEEEGMIVLAAPPP